MTLFSSSPATLNPTLADVLAIPAATPVPPSCLLFSRSVAFTTSANLSTSPSAASTLAPTSLSSPALKSVALIPLRALSDDCRLTLLEEEWEASYSNFDGKTTGAPATRVALRPTVQVSSLDVDSSWQDTISSVPIFPPTSPVH